MPDRLEQAFAITVPGTAVRKDMLITAWLLPTDQGHRFRSEFARSRWWGRAQIGQYIRAGWGNRTEGERRWRSACTVSAWFLLQ